MSRTIWEIIDRERWLGQRTLHGAHDYQLHNESLDRIEKAVQAEIDGWIADRGNWIRRFEKANRTNAELETRHFDLLEEIVDALHDVISYAPPCTITAEYAEQKLPEYQQELSKAKEGK